MLAGMSDKFLDFYEHAKPLVERFLTLSGASREDAQDAAQEAFTEGWLLVRRGKWTQQEVENPAAWIRQVAYRRYRRPPGSRRRIASVPAAPHDLPDHVSADHAEPTVQALTVLGALDQLADAEARAVIALDIDDMPGPQIAQILGVDEQRVRDLRKKARNHLKRYLPAAPGVRKEEQTR
jgi:RNA polymerase sigma factor (sigma-70 family)